MIRRLRSSGAAMRRRTPIGVLLYFTGALLLGLYFMFAAIQGDYGHLSRVQIEAEEVALRAELDALKSELASLTNKTQRLSDEFLDLDLLDERARDVLGVLRPTDLVLQ